jgi:hypothetical protein
MQADQDPTAEDRWLRALAELPRPELSSARQAEITAALRGALVANADKPTLGGRWYALIERWVEPALVVTCSGFVLVRLAMVLARYLHAA